MSLSPAICRQIVEHIGSRSDVCSLCRVSKSFQRVAERALYNTLYMHQVGSTILLCDILTHQPRLSALVEAITIYYEDGVYDQDGVEVATKSEATQTPLSDSYWQSLASALRSTHRLFYLNIHIASSENLSAAWILTDCTFQLRSFHCDLKWDPALISFLNGQQRLTDLCIVDYSDLESTPTTERQPSHTHHINPSSLPHLSTLECTFTEAAAALVPGRPVTRLKTCFSSASIPAKRVELSSLVSKLSLSTRPLRTLDIADSSYTETFSMEMLRGIALQLPAVEELRYLSTLVLPIAGRQVRIIPLRSHVPSPQ